MASQRNITGFIVISLLLVFLISFAASGDTDFNFNLGVEISGHIIPYMGVSYMTGVNEFGLNLGAGLPHDISSFDLADLAYQGTLYFRYDFINTDFYPRVQLKALSAPSSAETNEFLVLAGIGFQYLRSPKNFRYGGGVEVNLGIPISALDEFSFPVPYLSLETSYEFDNY